MIIKAFPASNFLCLQISLVLCILMVLFRTNSEPIPELAWNWLHWEALMPHWEALMPEGSFLYISRNSLFRKTFIFLVLECWMLLSVLRKLFFLVFSIILYSQKFGKNWSEIWNHFLRFSGGPLLKVTVWHTLKRFKEVTKCCLY